MASTRAPSVRVADRTVVEIEAEGVTLDTIQELRRIPEVAAVTVDESHPQVIKVQSAAGLTLTQTLLARFALRHHRDP